MNNETIKEAFDDLMNMKPDEFKKEFTKFKDGFEDNLIDYINREGDCPICNKSFEKKELPSIVKEFIIGRVTYDSMGGYFFINESNGNMQILAEIRGFGALQYKKGDPAENQDTLGQFIADAINEKMERDK